MTIEVTALDRNPKIHESPHTAATHDTAGNAPTASSPAAAPATVSSGEVTAAIQQLQTAINKGPNPDFKLDYLSGLSVVTVRSTITGEVVFQLPDTRALELARMIKDGASVGSLGLLNTKA
ncbi:MAG: flagellar protein FlaG [Steroidobacteraceae bacterium]